MRLPMERSHLDGLVVFVAVAELHGFRAAARHLGITPSAVSQTIRALEERVGAPLLSRSTRSVGLTEAGARLLAHARPAIEMLALGLDAAAGLAGEASGRLRINVPRPSLPLLANRLLPEFLQRYPHVQLELFGEDGLVDIVERGFDAGIRLGQLLQADMVAVPLSPPLRIAVVGAPAFFRKHGLPDHPKDLHRFPCIQLRGSEGAIHPWEFALDGQRMKVTVDGPLIVNDVEMSIHSVLKGIGLAQMPLTLAMHYIAKADMQTTLEDYAIEEPGLVLYYPSRNHALPKLRAFAEFARERMRRPFGPDDYLPSPHRT